MKRLSFLALLVVAGVALVASGCAPGNPLLNDAESSLENQNYQEAHASVDEALEEDPNNADAYLMRGQIYQEQAMEAEDPSDAARFTEQMMEAYNRATELDPGLEGEVETRRFFAYQSVMEQGIESFNRGSEMQDEQAFSEAADYFEAAGYIEPDSAAIFQNQAFALINAGREMEAIEPLERVVELGMEDPDVYAILGNLYALEERWDEAIEVLEEGRELFPESADIEDQLVNVYLQADRADEAIAYYREAVEREPDNATFRYNYGSLLLEAEQTEEAIEQLERAVELAPDNPNALYNLGAAYTNVAYELNEEAIEIDSELDGSQEPQEAEQLQQELNELLEQRNEAFENAIEPLERARQLAATDPNIQQEQVCQLLFQAYVHTDRTDDAQQVASCAGMDEEDVMDQQPQEGTQ